MVPLLILFATCYPAIQACADEIRPALLDTKEQSAGLFAVTWKVPLALLMFNVGVEAGQLLFIAVVLILIALLKRLPIAAP